MKRSQAVRLLLMGSAPVLLVACDAQEEAVLYKDVTECVAGARLTEDQCKAAFDHAKGEHERVAPRYTAQATCETDFGTGKCQAINHGAGIQYIPLMAAYALGYYAGRPNYYQSQPLYYSSTSFGNSGGYINSGGQPIARSTGNATVSRSSMQAPTRAVTMSRSGFGSSSSAKGGWGGGGS
jgi:uncharacterized protein YgiB involved in biofilm formation